jgi:hypothetical protein
VEIPHPKTYHAEFIAAAKKNRREIGTEIPIRIKLRAIMQGNYAAPPYVLFSMAFQNATHQSDRGLSKA